MTTILPPIRALTICVEFDDLLAITLRNARHFDDWVIVTAPHDRPTIALVSAHRRARLHVTDAFYRGGATFNKGAALEEGFDLLGRDGWLCSLDADVLLPAALELPALFAGNLYSPHRRQINDPAQWNPRLDWCLLPLVNDVEFAGYCQLFHAADSALADRPWFPSWNHAGGCDSDFQLRWPHDRKHRLPFEVLHLGPHGANWHGRATPRTDGTLPAEAARRAAAQAEMRRRRRTHGVHPERL